MRILMVHEHYQEPGGEDQSFAAERDLLAAGGHEVIPFTVHNDVIDEMSRLRVAAKTIWNRDIQHQLEDLIDRTKPQIAHFQNTFPLVSPGAFRAAAGRGVAVVLTLRNFRLTCVNAKLFRDGHVCELCLGLAVPIHGVRYACYRDDHAASTVVAAMLGTHHALGTWSRIVDRYIVLTEFARKKMATVLPDDRLVVKPNFVHPDPGPGPGGGGYALFVGRLAPEKGITTLLRVWEADPPDIELRILGAGAMAHDVRAAAARNDRITYFGHVTPAEVGRQLAEAELLVFPSEWYEGQPRTILEAFAVGTPVIASAIGGVEETVAAGRAGLLFPPGEADMLRSGVQELLADDAARMELRRSAREVFEERYSPSSNLTQLETIYEDAIERRLT